MMHRCTLVQYEGTALGFFKANCGSQSAANNKTAQVLAQANMKTQTC